MDGTLERLLAGAACVNEQWETEDDPDVLADPIMQLDIQVTQFLYNTMLCYYSTFLVGTCQDLSPEVDTTAWILLLVQLFEPI